MIAALFFCPLMVDSGPARATLFLRICYRGVTKALRQKSEKVTISTRTRSYSGRSLSRGQIEKLCVVLRLGLIIKLGGNNDLMKFRSSRLTPKLIVAACI